MWVKTKPKQIHTKQLLKYHHHTFNTLFKKQLQFIYPVLVVYPDYKNSKYFENTSFNLEIYLSSAVWILQHNNFSKQQ